MGTRLAESLVAESGVDVLLEEAIGAGAGMARLRDEVFDVVLAGHEPGDVDVLPLVAGIRAGGSDEPVIVIGESLDQELMEACLEAGAEACLCPSSTTARTLIWTVGRAVERMALTRENRRLVEAERQRLDKDHQEADRLLAQQRTVISDLEEILAGGVLPKGDGNAGTGDDDASDTFTTPLPPTLASHYRELLRAYVIMGSGNLAAEMGQLAEMLVTAGVSGRQAMRMHLDVLEEMVRSLGSRSARHVIARADLLGLEIMVHMAEGYRRRASI
jgi:DNA-binding NarL/FixJ family response regulator